MGISKPGIILIPFVLGVAAAATQNAAADNGDEALFEFQARGLPAWSLASSGPSSCWRKH